MLKWRASSSVNEEKAMSLEDGRRKRGEIYENNTHETWLWRHSNMKIAVVNGAEHRKLIENSGAGMARG